MSEKIFNTQKETLGTKLWNILYPIGIHLGCICAVGIAGSWLALLYFQRQGCTEAELVEKTAGLSLLYDCISAGILLPLLGKLYKKDQISKQKAPKSQKPLQIAGFVAVILLASVLLEAAIKYSGLEKFFPQYQQKAVWLYQNQQTVLVVLSVGILGPILEELLFRGLVYGRIRRYFGVGRAVLFSALLFALYHGNVIQFLYAGLLGTMLAFSKEKTGTLLTPVLAHMAVNLWSLFIGKII